jgi:hypothetical protein
LYDNLSTLLNVLSKCFGILVNGLSNIGLEYINIKLLGLSLLSKNFLIISNLLDHKVKVVFGFF